MDSKETEKHQITKVKQVKQDNKEEKEEKQEDYIGSDYSSSSVEIHESIPEEKKDKVLEKKKDRRSSDPSKKEASHSSFEVKPKKHKYLYHSDTFKAELFVIHKKCAMLRLYQDSNLIIVPRTKLAYVIDDFCCASKDEIAKLVIIYEAWKHLDIFEDRVNKYKKKDIFLNYLKQYSQ